MDCAVLVTRYKASTAPKLGAGGLIRAYGQAARDCLKTAAAAPAAAPAGDSDDGPDSDDDDMDFGT